MLVTAFSLSRELLPADHEWRNPAFINSIIAGLPVPERRVVSISLEEGAAGACMWLVGCACGFFRPFALPPSPSPLPLALPILLLPAIVCV